MTPPLKPVPELVYPLGSPGALCQVAASQLGYREGPSNDTAFGAWYPMNFQPWCAMFVSWCAWKAGVPVTVIPKHAYTPAGAAWFQSRGRLFTSPQVGDIGYVYYSSMGRIGHVFIVERIWYTDQGVLIMDTLEGNTNDTGSSQGNGVYRLLRADTTNLSYGRPAYVSQEDDMPYTEEQIKAMVRDVLNEGTAAGQASWAGTSAATLAAAQGLHNDVMAAGVQRFLVEGTTAQFVTVPGGRAWISGADLTRFGFNRLPLRIVPADHFLAGLTIQGATPPV